MAGIGVGGSLGGGLAGRGGKRLALSPDGPFGALAGASRKAAWRRRLLRRVAAAMLLLVAVVLVLTRPGPLGSAAHGGPTSSPSPTPTAGADIGSDINGGTRADPGTDAAPALGATAAPGGLGVVALAPRLGAAQVPPGLVGMSLPLLDPTMASRLRVGDIVDAYATGRKSPVARAARVIDVIAVTTSDLGVSGDDTGASGARVGAAYVFVAVEKTDASRISAGQSVNSGPTGYWIAVRGNDTTVDQAP